MTFTTSDLQEIVGRSSRLSERLQGQFVPAPSPGAATEKKIDARLAEWKRALMVGDARQFGARLAMAGQTEEAVRPLLGRVELKPGSPLPSWAAILEEVLLQISAGGEAAETTADSLPFEEITRPFARWAEARLEAAAGPSAWQRCSASAREELITALLRWLNSLAAPTLVSEFTAFRAVRQQLRGARAGLQLFGALPGVITREHYLEFIAHLRSGGLRDLFLEYPVLARLMAEVTELWVASEADFLKALEADWDDLLAHFPPPPAFSGLEEVTHLRSDLSDRHHGGRTVKYLAFASGRQLIYKPKSVALEVALGRLQEWLNQKFIETESPLAKVPFKVLRILTRPNHGWVEFISRQPCSDLDAARRFYQRAGMLLCVVYALEGTDYHNENLIAHGEHPVPIDQEGLLHHRGRYMNADGNELGSDLTANSRIAHSVIRTAILPYWRFGEDGRSVDISALGGDPEQESMIKSPRWAHVNTDQMALVYEYLTSRDSGNNAVFVGETRLSANDYLPELTQGFRDMYDFLQAHNEAILASGGPLEVFQGQTVRFIYRDTRVYFVLQRHALHTRFLRDGVDRSLQMEVLYRGFFAASDEQRHPFLALLEAEHHSLEGMDIPLLQPRSDQVGLSLETKATIEHAFIRPSYEEVRARFGGLSKDDRDFQLELITGALLTRTMRPQQEKAGISTSERSATRLAPLPAEELVREAMRIADQIAERAVWKDPEHVTWIGFVHVLEANRAQIQQLPNRLYDGSLGVAHFFASLQWLISRHFPAQGRENSEALDKYRTLARATVQSLLEGWEKIRANPPTLAGLPNELVAQFGLGAGLGVGSIIYSFTRLAHWLAEPRLLEVASEIAAGIDDNAIAADTKNDIMFGSAGAILGLLALHEARPDPAILQRAIACGQHLLSRRQPGPTGHRSWSAAPGGPFLTGFSHGAAGFAYALLRLAQVSGLEEFREAALEALAYEAAVYRPAVKNWPDFRSSPTHADTAPCWCSWCHGAPGIGLARLGTLASFDSPQIRQDIDAAVETTSHHALTEIDHLCCGNLGRADLLLLAGCDLDRPELIEEARSLTSEVIVRARQSGSYRLGNTSAYSINLFQGGSGIGYELLRMACPEEIPTVLLWQ